MPPSLLLAILVAITTAAYLIDRGRRSHRRAVLKALAREWKMHFATTDPFNLAPRVASMFPVPGAANLRICDVIYAQQGDRHRYIFTAEYTQGVLRHHLRVRRAATFCEAKDQAGDCSPIQLAKGALSVSAQYEALHLELVAQA